MSCILRRAVPTDGACVRSFVFETLRSYGMRPEPEGLDAPVVAFGTAGRDGQVLELVAQEDGLVVGAIALDFGSGKEEAQLTIFYVDARFRGRGTGRMLLEYVTRQARRQGLKKLSLETCTVFLEAVHLYEVTGWVRGPDRPSLPDRTYSLQLETVEST
jgi:GNAT superfamily N-acetyltransferase